MPSRCRSTTITPVSLPAYSLHSLMRSSGLAQRARFASRCTRTGQLASHVSKCGRRRRPVRARIAPQTSAGTARGSGSSRTARHPADSRIRHLAPAPVCCAADPVHAVRHSSRVFLCDRVRLPERLAAKALIVRARPADGPHAGVAHVRFRPILVFFMTNHSAQR